MLSKLRAWLKGKAAARRFWRLAQEGRLPLREVIKIHRELNAIRSRKMNQRLSEKDS